MQALGTWDDPAAVCGRASLIAALKGLGVAVGGAIVEPSDTADMAFVARALWVGGAGDVRVKTANGDTVTLAGVAAGTLLPVAVARVFVTGTTATNLVGLK